MKNLTIKNTYALYEQGQCHTKNLNKIDAEEILERHKRFFPELEWDIRPTNEEPQMKSRFFNR